MQVPLIEIRDLCHSYQNQEVLHHINLEVYHGDFISIIGPNGGGKTTLLKLIIGLLKPTRGEILIKGQPFDKERATIGYVPQYINHNLNFPATALDVVLMGCHRPARRFKLGHCKKDREAAQLSLEKIGIENCAEKKIRDLSGGQRQRVLIARALVSEPELLVLDEPTASIDTKGQTDFYNLLQELNKDITILMVSHDLLMISSYAKSIACLNKGLSYHPTFTSFNDVLNAFYSCSVKNSCLSTTLSQEHLQIHQKGSL
ncbi:metal ABC transporter ATP-binding protein [Desulfotalea psychrophila]|uniref:Related to Mn/Zn ABC transporter, ATP-binding protein n=1 Tax=Desulfotalea psychrophila (strain LSv54 / DSM 12343) TaxID=177439 RepID=Q6AIP0_DESPS|nr:metal ABC transporter ATP-binding protein [Desulfotalea psychrophila]CAG37790.1 related to Mn/Zn ABC transporter, ATP-binding protein [Desulfotalea psychrophila LSv54]